MNVARFRVAAVLNEERFPEIEGSSKKVGNVLAAQEAIRVLQERGEFHVPKAILGQVGYKVMVIFGKFGYN